MSTNGHIVFVVDGTQKVAYNHSDSYPDGLGVNVLTWLRAAMDAPDVLRRRIAELRVVDSDSTPTEEDIARLRKYANLNVSQRSLNEWYTLLRETQGKPHAMIEAGVIEDAKNTFFHWKYVIDLDSASFEVHTDHLIKSWPLNRLPDNAEFIQSLGFADDTLKAA